MKKFFSMLVVIAMSVMMLPVVASAYTVNTVTLGSGVHGVVIKGEAVCGSLSCDGLLNGLISGIGCPEHGGDTPSGGIVVIPPAQDNDTPSGDTGVTPPQED